MHVGNMPGDSLSRCMFKLCFLKIDSVNRRPHQNLASVGVAALVQLVTAAGDQMDASTWIEIIQVGSAISISKHAMWPTKTL